VPRIELVLDINAPIDRCFDLAHFRDSLVRGAFARFDHDHYFESMPNGRTRMRDVFDYTAPLGFLRVLADRRNQVVARLAESP
jgi:ligand-binding SRPBCC domain-containing protein